jgi:hypothetical protein
MAISRMQQPRQMYGLGSFVKKAVGKVTKPFTKVAKKIVPREVAGIMRAAAPFLPAGYREAAYLLGTAKQTGRISPIDLALTAAPTFFSKTKLGQGIARSVGDFTLPGMETNLRDFTLGTPAEYEARIGSVTDRVMSGEGADRFLDTKTTFFRDPKLTKEATSGILGQGGKMFQFGKASSPKILDTKAGQFLLGGDDNKFSKAKLAGVGLTTLSLIQNANTPREAGIALAQSTGDSDDLARGEELFSLIKPELFRVPEAYRLPVPAANGGLMRTNYANGTKKFNDKYLAPEYEDDFKKFLQELREQNKEMDLDNIMEMFKQKMRRQDPILEAKDGGLMRTNYAIGSDDEPLRPDPTKPIQPFQPKPVGPVLPDKKMAEFDLKDYMEEFERVFPDMIEKRGTQEYMDMLEDYFRGLASKDREGIMMAGSLGDEKDDISKEIFRKPVKDLNPDELQELMEELERLREKFRAAKGGRANLALGTKPTTEESGLGGLPIEADMRYTGGKRKEGGFMPYGAKEKADDVPARLSKNEFVFTADAVRAAGGGSVNEGAKKMYTAMKQLEKKPEAKGMMA